MFESMSGGRIRHHRGGPAAFPRAAGPLYVPVRHHEGMNPNEPRAVADETLDHYMERTSSARVAALDDPLYAAHLTWTRMALSLADQAMEHEGIPEATRRRVVRAIVFGSFDEDEAVRRIEDQAARIRKMELMPLPKLTAETLADLDIQQTP